MRAVWLLSGIALVAGACRSGRVPSGHSPEERSPGVVTEHRFLAVVGTPVLQDLGSDCSLNGSAVCRTGLCLHAGVALNSQYVCSQRCGADGTACPAGWNCVQAYPAPDSEICVPASKPQASSQQ